MNNTKDNTYLHYLHNVITNISKTDIDNKKQKRYDILLSILILAPIFIVPTIIALGYTMIGILILVVCYTLVAIIGINKRKNINKRFYKIKNAYKNIKLNNIADEKIINELYDNSALTFIINPSNELFNFIYNWLNNNKLLKEEILNIYMFDGKTIKDIFNYNDINEQIVFLCIFLKDLNLSNSNLKQFSKERYAAGVKYLDEIIKRPIMDYQILSESFYTNFKEAIIKFAKSEDNKSVYAIVFDCDEDGGQVCIRYANEKYFETIMEDYDKYKKSFESYGKYSLVAYKYYVGDFKFIDFEEKGEMKHFNDTYYYYITEHKYFGEGNPIEIVKYDNNKINIKTDLNYLDELWKKLIIENIKRLQDEDLGIDKTDDFVMFMTLHDQSDEEIKEYLKRTVDDVTYEKVFINNKIIKQQNPKENSKKQSNTINNKTKLTKEEIIKSLPKFKYHPNLYANGMVTFANGICQCCEKEVKAYIETMYCKEDIDCICLHCVADGSAAKKFEGSFIQDAEEINNPEAIEELYSRTPGYYSWQGEYWLACCDDYCEFVGDVGTKELIEMGIADEVFDEYVKKSNYEDIDWVKDRLLARGDVAGYLFKCKKCGKYHLHVDMF